MITSIVEAIKLGRDKERRERRRTRKEEVAAKKKLGLLREGAGIPGNHTPAPRDGQVSAVEELRLLNLRIREDVFEVRNCIKQRVYGPHAGSLLLAAGAGSPATVCQHVYVVCNLFAAGYVAPSLYCRCGLRGTWGWTHPTGT